MVALNRKQTATTGGEPPLRAVFTEIRQISPLFALDDDTWYRALGAAMRCLAAGLSIQDAARRVIAEIGED